jgi:hypothetical protein
MEEDWFDSAFRVAGIEDLFVGTTSLYENLLDSCS